MAKNKFSILARLRRQKEVKSPQSSEELAPSIVPVAVDAPGPLLLCGPKSTEGAVKAHIVLVNELGGSAKQAWTHDNGICWPHDLLSLAFPQCRISAYQYKHSDALSILDNLADEAACLMAAVSEQDKISGQSSREPPSVIFVCHGLGGIVVKKALSISQKSSPDMFAQVQGLLFLGTPHCDSTTSPLAETIDAILLSLSTRIRPANPHSHYHNELISKTTQDFESLAHYLIVTSFYELCATSPANRVLVDRSSVALRSRYSKRVAIPTDHFAMACPPNETSAAYVSIRCMLDYFLLRPSRSRDLPTFSLANPSLSYQNAGGNIGIQGTQVNYGVQKFIFYGSSSKSPRSDDVVSEASSLTGAQKDVQRNLDPGSLGDFNRVNSIDKPLEGTIRWLRHDSVYMSWESGSSVQALLLSGEPGSGKSTILCEVSRQIRELTPMKSLVCSYFCRQNGDISTMQELCFLRTILHQITLAHRKSVKLMQKFSSQFGSEFFISPTLLWQLLERLLTQHSVERICIIIDAMDECDENSQVAIVKGLSNLQLTIQPERLKILMSTRSNSSFLSLLETRDLHATHLRMDDRIDLINGDVNKYIDFRMDRIFGSSKKTKADIRKWTEFVTSSAGHSFICAKLIMDHIGRSKSLPRLTGRTLAVPMLDEMYCGLLQRIDAADRADARDLICCMIAGLRPLHLPELEILLNMIGQHTSISELLDHCPPRGTERIAEFLGSMVRVHEDRIEFFHQTVKEYFLRYAPKQGLVQYSGFPHCVYMASGHAICAERCMQYLLLLASDPEALVVEKRSPSLSGSLLSQSATSRSMSVSADGSQVRPRGDDYDGSGDHVYTEDDEFGVFGPIFVEALEQQALDYDQINTRQVLHDYAARYWHHHYRLCEPADQQRLSSIARNLYDPGRRGWLQYLLIKEPMHHCPVDTSEIGLAAAYGHQYLVRQILDRDKSFSDCDEPIFWASKRGHRACLELLIPRIQSTQSTLSHLGKQSLSVAAEHGQIECVQYLLATRLCEINDAFVDNKTPLALAVTGAHKDVTELLLHEQLIDVNIGDDEQRSPLMLAVATGSLDVVSVLAKDARVKFDLLDKTKRSALARACSLGISKTVRVLLPKSGEVIDTTDDSGRTPLIHAIRATDYDSVIRLRKHGANMRRPDIHGRTPVSWAAECSDIRILRSFIKAEPDSLATKDENGWTPLAWTLDPPGYPLHAAAILEQSPERVNDRDDRQDTQLMTAVYWPGLRNAKVMLQSPLIEVNARNADGATALCLAASRGDSDMVWAILSHPDTDVNVRDSEGKTALIRAAAAGHYEVVASLLAEGSVDAGVKDNQNMNALMWAADRDHGAICELLKQEQRIPTD